MVKRILWLSAAVAAASSVSLFAGCGSSSTGTGPGGTPDGGGTNPDGANPPPVDGAVVIPPVDGGSTTGTQLATGADFVDAVTDDGHVLYDNGTNLFVVPIAGGTPQMLGAFSVANGDQAGAVGSVAIVITGVSQTTGIGTVSVWTQAHGLVSLSTTSVPGRGTIDISKDGTKVAYFDGAATATATANLMVAAPDGTGKSQLAAGVQFLQNCSPQITFGGGYVVASYCTNASPDAGTPQANVASWAAGSTTPTQLASAALGFAVDPTAAHVLVSTAAGMTVYPIGSATGTLVDAAGGFGGFTKDGMSVIYTTQTGNSLKRSTIASPAPVTLLPSGAAGLDAVSPDESWALVSQNQDMNTGNFDLYIASAKTAGTATALDSTTTAAFFGDAFTADSSHVLFLSGIVKSTTTGDSWGNLSAAASAGGAPAVVTTNVVGWTALAGTRILVAANFIDNTTGGVADLATLDAAAPGTPTVIASKADGFFLTTPDLKNVVYSTSTQAAPAQGIWVAPIQ